MITKEQFELLEIGNELVDERGESLIIMDRLTNVIFAEDDNKILSYFSFNEIREDYSIKESPKHLYGIPYGDYSDKEVYVIYSDESLDKLSKYATKLHIVDYRGFTLQDGFIANYAKVISNNVDLIPYSKD